MYQLIAGKYTLTDQEEAAIRRAHPEGKLECYCHLNGPHDPVFCTYCSFHIGLDAKNAEHAEYLAAQEARSRVERMVQGSITILIFAGLVVAFWGIPKLWQILDSNGYVPHHKAVDVYMDEGWIVGENHYCVTMRPFRQPDEISGTTPDRVAAIACEAKPNSVQLPHNINVTFWGRIDNATGPSNQLILQMEWTCAREVSSFICKIRDHPMKGNGISFPPPALLGNNVIERIRSCDEARQIVSFCGAEGTKPTDPSMRSGTRILRSLPTRLPKGFHLLPNQEDCDTAYDWNNYCQPAK